ncbi:winged helix-turn-helix domain-containing protein [Oscillibacter sp. MSJ-2]|uniref:Winged helix-turn-helix domain-containing protein n=1 Tax=Dysosmobacter acutus TaxID=2841504 RepID=A0ABS6F7T8_9FIRM|nr:winged helix-turn-helix domain-containing protein [Dysosmobacter acutus]MBU5626105.1 winged helix-turn-helix domain-containing protein [Dysosmobacter acutus]
MEDIIIIRATDPDGTIYQRIRDALGGIPAEEIDLSPHKNAVLDFPGLIIQIKAGVVLRGGISVQLNYGEFSMLCHLARHPGRIFSRDQLYNAVYGEDHFFSNTVPNTICRIRSKNEPDPRHPTYIKTVVGMGYKFVIPEKH